MIPYDLKVLKLNTLLNWLESCRLILCMLRSAVPVVIRGVKIWLQLQIIDHYGTCFKSSVNTSIEASGKWSKTISKSG